MTTKKLHSVLTSLRAIPDGLPDHETRKRVECLQRPVVRLVAAVRPDLADPADDADTLPAWERMARRLEAICPELPRIDEVRDASGPVGDRELNLVTPGGMARWRDHAAAVVESLVELLEAKPAESVVEVKPETGSAIKRRWSKQEVNEAVRAYRTERQKQYNEYEQAIGRARGQKQRHLIRRARKVFGRNVIAAALGCSRGLVSESTTFKAISAQLFFDRQAGKPRMSNRIGMAAAIDQSYKPAPSRRHEADPDPDEELRRLIETQDDDDPPADFEDSDLDS